jgi:hypothetical protein
MPHEKADSRARQPDRPPFAGGCLAPPRGNLALHPRSVHPVPSRPFRVMNSGPVPPRSAVRAPVHPARAPSSIPALPSFQPAFLGAPSALPSFHTSRSAQSPRSWDASCRSRDSGPHSASPGSRSTERRPRPAWYCPQTQESGQILRNPAAAPGSASRKLRVQIHAV